MRVATGLPTDARLTDYSPLSSADELAQRLLSPLTAQRLHERMIQIGARLDAQAIDLAHESFAIYVPKSMPAAGYALLVFVPPWEDARIPSQWLSALDRHGVIFVSATHAGNDANVLDRRIPLALLAATNIARRFRIDPQRTYVGGFSGGSRVALHLALAYPDIFHGALLNAGSDPIGEAGLALPSADHFRQFQDSTRLVFVTGKDDPARLDRDARSRQSLEAWCAFDLHTQTPAWTGHEPADPAALDRALAVLEEARAPADARLDACRRRVEAQLDDRLRAANELLRRGKRDEVRKAIEGIDAQFGGLSAQPVLGLAARVAAEPY